MTQLCCYVDFFPLPKIFVEMHQSSDHGFFFFSWTALMDTNRCMHGVSALCWKGAGSYEGGTGFL